LFGSLRVMIAVVEMEDHGGVANQIVNLAVGLKKRAVHVIVLVRNPLAVSNPYREQLIAEEVPVWSPLQGHYLVVRDFCRICLWLLCPVALLDASIRRKNLSASRSSIWGVLRRMGYWGLDGLFLLQLTRGKIEQKVRIIQFRNPDCWYFIKWAKRLGYKTNYLEDTIVPPDSKYHYYGLASVLSDVDMFSAISVAAAASLKPICPPNTVIKVMQCIVERPPTTLISAANDLKPIRIGYLGRLDKQKDIYTLISATKIAVQAGSPMKLSIYGDGPERDKLEKYALDLDLPSNVVFFKGRFPRQNLPDVMGELDIVALPSLSEGLGVVLVEAMSYGKPVVATAVGGIKEVVVQNVTGILVPPASPDLFAKALISIAADPEKYYKMSISAHDMYESTFHPSRIISEYIGLFEETATITQN